MLLPEGLLDSHVPTSVFRLSNALACFACEPARKANTANAMIPTVRMLNALFIFSSNRGLSFLSQMPVVYEYDRL